MPQLTPGKIESMRKIFEDHTHDLLNELEPVDADRIVSALSAKLKQMLMELEASELGAA